MLDLSLAPGPIVSHLTDILFTPSFVVLCIGLNNNKPAQTLNDAHVQFAWREPQKNDCLFEEQQSSVAPCQLPPVTCFQNRQTNPF